MKVIILAAGQGTRLRPYTNNIPKCMVKLAGKPILHHQLEVLESAGLKDVVVVGGYCVDQIEAKGIKIIFNSNFDATNMVATLFCAEDHIQENEDLLISYSDIIYESRLLQSLLENDAPISISVDRNWQNLWEARMEDPLTDAETLKVTEGNRVLEVGKKPRCYDDIEGQYIGLIKVRKDTIKIFCESWKYLDKEALYDGKDFGNMFMTSFIQCLIDRGIVTEAVFTDGGWVEIDSASDLEFYDDLHLQNNLDKFIKLGS